MVLITKSIWWGTGGSSWWKSWDWTPDTIITPDWIWQLYVDNLINEDWWHDTWVSYDIANKRRQKIFTSPNI